MTDILIIRSDVDQGKVKATYVIGFLLNDIPEDPDLIIEQYRGKSKWKCARKLEPSCPLIFWSLQQLRISKTSTLTSLLHSPRDVTQSTSLDAICRRRYIQCFLVLEGRL